MNCAVHMTLFIYFLMKTSLRDTDVVKHHTPALMSLPCVLRAQVCALRVTDRARRRILKSGGQVMTFDQLALAAPKGQGTVLLSGEALDTGTIHWHFWTTGCDEALLLFGEL